MEGVLGRSTLWTGFVFSTFCVLISGLELAFNVYALALKEAFNLTQTEVEVIGSAGTLGIGLSFMESVCTWYYGFKVTCVIVLICLPTSCGLFSLMAYYSQFFQDWPSIIATVHLLIFVMTSCGYLAVTKVCIGMFSKTHTSKIIAIYMSVSCFGKIICAGMLDVLFDGNLTLFFGAIAAMAATAYGVCFWVLYPIASNADKDEELVVNATGSTNLKSSDISTNEMLKSSFFQIIFWTSAVFYGCGFTCISNVSVIAQSVGMANPVLPVYVCSLTIIIVRLTFGTVFDKFSSHWSGLSLLLVSYTSFITAMLVSIFYLEASSVILTSVLMSVGMAPGLLTPVSIILWRFGRSHYSPVRGCFYSVFGASQTILQLMLGFFYDSAIIKRGETGRTCYGRDCFYSPFLTMIFITLFIFILQTLNFIIYAPGGKPVPELRQKRTDHS